MQTATSSEFGVRRAVGQQRIGDEFSNIDRGVADLTSSVRANAQTLECTVNVIQRRFDGGDALVVEIGHD
jgi:hypothetical protein